MSEPRGVSRRQFLRLVSATGAAVSVGQALPLPPYAQALSSDQPLTVLAYNENPFGMCPAARDAVIASASNGNRYPKQTSDELRAALAQHLGVDEGMIVLGAGSIEPLKIATDMLCAPGHGPVVAEPTFEAVVMYAGLDNIEPVKVPLTTDHRVDLERMRAAATAAGLVYICNPNNPTASIVDKDAVRNFLDHLPAATPVLVDEAYHEWVDNPRYESCVRYVREGRNVIVLRTFSKVYGLAGLRVGYAVAAKETAKRMEPRRLQNSLNTAGLAAARASLADQENAARVRERNSRIRTAFLAWLEEHNLKTVPSDTNFVMIDIGRPVPPVIDALKQRGFLVGRLFPSMPNHLRISLGTEEQMARFQPALAEVLRV
jgi:histidinol-phosphate aminotransferase